MSPAVVEKRPLEKSCRKLITMSSEQLVDFDNETVVLQPSNLAALFFSATKDEATTPAAVNKTFESMGLRSEKAVAAHLLLENTYESNLVSDIAKVDYLAGNLGRTNLRLLAGLPPFVDNIYVFGYLSREECVFRNQKLSYTRGKEGRAKLVVANIANALERALGKCRANTAIVHTVGEGKAESNTICATIARIEKNTSYKAKRSWFELHPGKEVAGYFVVKCDVSEVSLEELHRVLPVFERSLVGGSGYGIYSIDYTQDFSGVLDCKALVGFLGFETAGNFCTAIGGDGPKILENTDSVGEHVCTWIETAPEGHTTRTKIYNKVVSNFEAGEIREPDGGHLAEYADCPNLRLSFRTNKLPPASKKPWREFPSKKTMASSLSSHPASNGKISPPTWTGALSSQTDRKATSSSRGGATQKQAESLGSTCAPPPQMWKIRPSGKKQYSGQQQTLASGLARFSGSTFRPPTKKGWRSGRSDASGKTKTPAPSSQRAKNRRSSTQTEASCRFFYQQRTRSSGCGRPKNALQ